MPNKPLSRAFPPAFPRSRKAGGKVRAASPEFQRQLAAQIAEAEAKKAAKEQRRIDK